MPRKPKVVRPDIAEMEQAEAPQGNTLVETLAPELPEQKSNDPVATHSPTLEEITNGDDTELKNVKIDPKPEFKPGDVVVDEELLGQIEILRQRVRVTDEATTNQVLQAIIDGKWSRKVIMLTPFNRPINPHAHFAICAQIKKNPWMGYEYETDTVIQRARNILAHRFLKSDAEWSWWIDQDTVAPYGAPGNFYVIFGANPGRLPPDFAGMHTLPRLLSHGKTIVGGVYAQRKPNGMLVIQPDISPRGQEDKNLVAKLRSGPFNSLYPVDYVATGCALVHRSVYESIQQKFPELAPKHEKEPWNFFGNAVESSGEDIHFCKLAAAAGHVSYLDTAVFCGHIGENVFFP